VRLPASAGRRKTDFLLRLPEQEPFPADCLRCDDGTTACACSSGCRPPPLQTVAAELIWKNHPLGQVTLPSCPRRVRAAADPADADPVRTPGGPERWPADVSWRRSAGPDRHRPARSATSLAPVVDLGLHVQFPGGARRLLPDVPVQLSSSQLGRASVAHRGARKFHAAIGTWLTT